MVVLHKSGAAELSDLFCALAVAAAVSVASISFGNADQVSPIVTETVMQRGGGGELSIGSRLSLSFVDRGIFG